MPDIVWTDKFRLAVIRRIAATLQSYVGGTTCVESESVYRDVSTIVMVSFDDDRDLDSTTSKIEAALGCTLGVCLLATLIDNAEPGLPHSYCDGKRQGMEQGDGT
jgi:hypothetical protein